MGGYDVFMVLWGIVFVLVWVGFIAGMNALLQRENRTQDELADEAALPSGPGHPVTPAA
jgi:hypothetical protein